MKNRKNKKSFFTLIIVAMLCFSIVRTVKNSEIKDDLLVIKEADKVTLLDDFLEMVEDNKVETVYINEGDSTLLFSVKEKTKVPLVDYKTTEKKAVNSLKLESEEQFSKNSQTKNVIAVYRTFNPDNEDFKETLLKNEVQIFANPFTLKKESSFLSSLIIRIIILVIIITIFSNMFEISNQKVKTVDNSEIPTIKFNDIAGNKEAKSEMEFLVKYLKNPEQFKKMNAEIPRGVLFYGAPGTGKTLLAKAIAGEAGVPFYQRSASEFIEKYVGVGSQRVRALFNEARKNAPCIIFIDEIDAIGAKRGHEGSKEHDQTLNQLLVELDGFSSANNILVIAATNRLDTLDKALIRPGRFDKHIAISLPDVKDREEILSLYMKNKNIAEDVSVKEFAALTYGFSGSALKSLVNEAALIAVKNNSDIIAKKDFEDAFIKISTGSHPKNVAHDNREKAKLIAYHEAGHAIAAKLFTNNTVNKITIIGTTSGVGGYTSITPAKEGFLSKEDLYNEIRVLYGGRVAEYLLFNKDKNKVTTGASNDLEQISNLLDTIISRVGMHDELLFKLSEHEHNKEDVMKYKKEIAKQLYNEVVECLDKNIFILHEVSEVLLEKETIDNKELVDIINRHKIIITNSMNEDVLIKNNLFI